MLIIDTDCSLALLDGVAEYELRLLPLDQYLGTGQWNLDLLCATHA
jgi:hypothetical protein